LSNCKQIGNAQMMYMQDKRRNSHVLAGVPQTPWCWEHWIRGMINVILRSPAG
jgi:hypothetical protein